MAPPDGGYVGSFFETPVASIDFNISSTSKGKSRKNDFNGKNPQTQQERKAIVMKDIRSFFVGSTIVKSSTPFYLKENKIIKID